LVGWLQIEQELSMHICHQRYFFIFAKLNSIPSDRNMTTSANQC
jgi:hypothetical protein